jgi:hypothetical protein
MQPRFTRVAASMSSGARKPAPVASRDPHFDWSEHAGIDPMFERAP